jgi:cytochrome c oxidase subunit IV
VGTAGEEKAEVAHTSPMRYVISYALLVVLTAVTYASARYNLGAASNVIALGIAVTKGTIVALFFMHLWDHRGANRLVFVVALLFVGVMISFVLMDLSTRFPLALGSFSNTRVTP